MAPASLDRDAGALARRGFHGVLAFTLREAFVDQVPTYRACCLAF